MRSIPKKNILIVDDNARNRLLLQEILMELGFKTIMAENGKIAIDLLSNNNVDLIFMDIEMPLMNGLETIIHIRNNFPEPKNKVPIIILTAHNIKDYSNGILGLSCEGILEKPFSPVKINEITDKFFNSDEN
ncbi:MAG: hypothetical protein A2275_05410 [Bacteroidetes bacterium RIFOXYA12_FULL_35_11]|nr:MAG: hypothetical protein A2X01_10720 [Bacteroidetes bacterium GWF2_35_48]OFY73827.1 MAG: hypothetical protein A2275_05410 [Bacteroidetes bacterium RIFOXYA12_FULL_35_11]